MTARTRWTAAELMAEVFPEPKWAVPGLLAEGANLLCGKPKLGKSWLALNLGLAIASGGLALGKVPVDQGDVLYLALEDPGRRLQDRVRIVLAGEAPPERLTLETHCDPLTHGGTELIEEWLDEHPDARLVIVDVFTKVRGSTDDRSSRYESDYTAMAQLKDIADRYGVAFLVVHHTRKAESEDFLDAVSGTQGIAGAADAVLILKRSRGSAEATLQITGRDVEETEYPMNLAADIGTWQMLDGPASDYTQSDERRRILEAVRAEEGIGPKAISEASGVKYDVVKHLVRKMVDDDKLDTDGSGRYFPVSHSLPSPRSPDGEDRRSGARGAVNGTPMQRSPENGQQPHSPPLSEQSEWGEHPDRQGARDRAAEAVA